MSATQRSIRWAALAPAVAATMALALFTMQASSCSSRESGRTYDANNRISVVAPAGWRAVESEMPPDQSTSFISLLGPEDARMKVAVDGQPPLAFDPAESPPFPVLRTFDVPLVGTTWTGYLLAMDGQASAEAEGRLMLVVTFDNGSTYGAIDGVGTAEQVATMREGLAELNETMRFE